MLSTCWLFSWIILVQHLVQRITWISELSTTQHLVQRITRINEFSTFSTTNYADKQI
jgi:hypothetical protein